MKSRFLALSLGLTLVGAGCQTGVQTVPQKPTATTTVPVATSKTIPVNESDNNSTLNATPGDQVSLVLNSTYWTIAPTDSDILISTAEPVYTPNLAGHIPGSGSGTVTAIYKVAKTGTVKLTASRVSCGEALRCTGDQGSFAVTIIVK